MERTGKKGRTEKEKEEEGRQKEQRTTSQNLNPRSTSSFGDFTPGNVSSQISSAIACMDVSQFRFVSFHRVERVEREDVSPRFCREDGTQE
jgi:hypothetical protein